MLTSPIKPEIVARRLQNLTEMRPRLAIQLGSGFKSSAARMEIQDEIPYAKLSGFPRSRVPGHEGRLLLGTLGGVPVLLLSGRAHYYEGHSMREIGFPICVLAQFGIKTLLLTNAAGAVNREFATGDFMRIKDHINFMGTNPLRGILSEGQPPFVDLSRVYDSKLGALIERAAAKAKANLRAGVYLAVSGPTYETPAEISAFRAMGADAVGMSTVPEAIFARYCGMKVAALSCVTNVAGGEPNVKLSHEDVLEVSERCSSQSANLLEEFAKLYAKR